MKIFNIENGIKKIYVQMNDIIMLFHFNKQIPASILEKVFTGTIIVDDSNKMKFIEFTQPNEIRFFKSLDWIIDYKKTINLSEEEIKIKKQEISNEINKIANKFNSMSDKNKKNNQSLVQKHNLLSYKMKYLTEILYIKQGRHQIELPIVPDSDGFSLDGNDICDYKIKSSLDPNKVLLFRKDGKKLSNDEKIPQNFLQTGISIALIKRYKNNIGEYEINNYLTEDNQYFVTEFKIKNYDNNYEEKEEKGIKKLIKRIFNK